MFSRTPKSTRTNEIKRFFKLPHNSHLNSVKALSNGKTRELRVETSQLETLNEIFSLKIFFILVLSVMTSFCYNCDAKKFSFRQRFINVDTVLLKKTPANIQSQSFPLLGNLYALMYHRLHTYDFAALISLGRIKF